MTLNPHMRRNRAIVVKVKRRVFLTSKNYNEMDGDARVIGGNGNIDFGGFKAADTDDKG